VLERRGAGYRPFEEVRDRIAALTVDQQAKDRARDEITRIAAKIKENKPKTAAEFTALAGGNITANDTQWFGKADTIAGLGNNSAFSAWAFSAKQNDVGDIIGTQRGPIIPYLYSIRAAGIAPLEEVKAKVENDAKLEKARQLAQQALMRSLPAATVDALGAKLSLPSLEANINRQGYIAGFNGDTSALVDAAMTAPVGEVKGPVMTGDGAVMFQVIEQKRADAAALAQNRAQYMDTLRQQESRNLRATLLQKLRKASTIDINKKLVEPAVPQQAG